MARGRKPGTPPTGRQAETLIKKGEVRNPSGRSTASQLARMALEETMQNFLNEEVDATVGGKVQRMKRLDMLLHGIFKEAIEGKGNKVSAVSEIFDRAFGKAKQAIDHTGISPVTIVDDVPTPADPRIAKTE